MLLMQIRTYKHFSLLYLIVLKDGHFRMKKIARMLTSRIFLFAVGVCAQVAWMTVFAIFLYQQFPWVEIIIRILTVGLVLYIVNGRLDPAYRLAWTLLILMLPIFGVVVYLLYGNSRKKTALRRRFSKAQEIGARHLRENGITRDMIGHIDPSVNGETDYIRNATGFPLYVNQSAKYYKTGDDAMPDILDALQSAKSYIFMEYYIIAPGYFWDRVHEILKQKVNAGIDVRLIYDDFGCAGRLPWHYYRELQKEGIKCACFNPLHFIGSVVMNYRDHRKILVVDGKTGFTGGFNIADEYINEIERFGHWKDAGIRLTGAPVWSFVSMFLQMWSVTTGITEKLDAYSPDVLISPAKIPQDGFVQPYQDVPLDNEAVGENVYLQIIGNAKKYVYIYTPYLVLSDEMMGAMTMAAKRGIDLRIVTPHVPDQKLVFLVTQSYYGRLIEAGVRIYEYSPGFIHSKVILSDGQTAAVGTINFDYRSLYLQYEDAVFLYGVKTLRSIHEDMMSTFEVSEEITLDFVKHRNIFIRFLQIVMRVFAPLI